ncbi:hypothetical protein DL89DRAFT_271275 [Linderina pennispora]|uniref:Uncharacterized protein n=1 Tax=Linderina pennispora TaxID=61395 RepID=A0A1Y1VV86_9FUNG|nr:uncharacterized protein DL89DRAFT_271275 [Linderina pennispora]ORX65198.1 hypothetical protein DL89DRAFT_271275 [Linderina pennispora]
MRFLYIIFIAGVCAASEIGVGVSPYAIPPGERNYGNSVSILMDNSTLWTGSQLFGNHDHSNIAMALSQGAWTNKGWLYADMIPGGKAGCGPWTMKDFSFSEPTFPSSYSSKDMDLVKVANQACLQRMSNWIEGICGRKSGLFTTGGCSCGFVFGEKIDAISTARSMISDIIDEDMKKFDRERKDFVPPAKCDTEIVISVDCSPKSSIDLTMRTIMNYIGGEKPSSSSSKVRQIPVSN